MAKRKKPAAARRRAAAVQPPTQHGAYTLKPDDLERSLLTGENRGLLEDYFGPDAYGQLRDLSRDASMRSVRGGARVLILPGIMGSTLARRGVLGIPDLLWLNPIAVAFGRLTELALDGALGPFTANGVILLAYLKLKLRLKIAGFDADFFPYDWRHSLKDLG